MSVVARPTKVSVALGSEIVLSAVGATTVNVVSWASAVEPSKIRFESLRRILVAIGAVYVVFV